MTAQFTYAFGPGIKRLRSNIDPQKQAMGQRQKWRKDILRCGTWTNKGWKRPWVVTRETLQAIAENFKAQRAAGLRTNVILAPHDAKDQHAESPNTKIGEVYALSVEGDALYAHLWTASLDNPTVYQMDLKGLEVSAEVHTDYVDGTGRTWPWRLQHVAVVTEPVIHGQGNWFRLALKGDKMAVEEMAVDSWSFEEVKGILSQLGYSVPDSITNKDQFSGWLLGVADTEPEGDETETPVDDGAGGTMTESMAAAILQNKGSSPLQLAKAGRVMAAVAEAARKQVLSMAQGVKDRAKQTFTAALDSHVSAGRITLEDKAELEAAGEECGYKLSLISHLERMAPKVNTAGPKTRRLGLNVSPDPVSGDRPTDDQCAAAVKAWGGKI